MQLVLAIDPSIELSPSSPARVVLEAVAGYLYNNRAYFNARALSQLIDYATAADLDEMGKFRSLRRNINEDDSTYRTRIIQGALRGNLATKPGLFAELFSQFPDRIFDLQLQYHPTGANAGTTDLWVQGLGDGAQSSDPPGNPTTQLLSDITAYLGAVETKPLDAVYRIQAPTFRRYYIALEYFSSEAGIEDRILTSLRNLITEKRKFEESITEAQVSRAAFIEGVTNVRVTRLSFSSSANQVVDITPGNDLSVSLWANITAANLTQRAAV